MNRLKNEGLLDIGNYESLPTYESCILGKMTKSSFIENDERAKEILSLVHTYVCGPMNVNAKGGI